MYACATAALVRRMKASLADEMGISDLPPLTLEDLDRALGTMPTKAGQGLDGSDDERAVDHHLSMTRGMIRSYLSETVRDRLKEQDVVVDHRNRAV